MYAHTYSLTQNTTVCNGTLAYYTVSLYLPGGEGRAARRADQRRDACLGDGKMGALLRHAGRATRLGWLTKPANPALLLPPRNLPLGPWEPYSSSTYLKAQHLAVLVK